MSEQTIAKYAVEGECPFCGSTNLDYNEVPQGIGDTSHEFDVKCPNCNREFTRVDCQQFSHYQYHVGDEGEPRIISPQSADDELVRAAAPDLLEAASNVAAVIDHIHERGKGTEQLDLTQALHDLIVYNHILTAAIRKAKEGN